MKKLVIVFAVLGVLSLTSCNRDGCPNKLDAQPDEFEQID